MARFQHPTQRQAQPDERLFDDGLGLPRVVRITGVDAGSAEAARILDENAGAIRAFISRSAQNHALGMAPIWHARTRLAPGVEARYVNRAGEEIVTIAVQVPQRPRSEVPERPIGEPEPDGPMTRVLLVLYKGDRIAAIPMALLGQPTPAVVFARRLRRSRWARDFQSAQYRFASPMGAVLLSPLRFRIDRIESTERFWATRVPMFWTGAQSSGDASLFPVMNSDGERLWLPTCAMRAQGNGALVLEQDYASDFATEAPTARDPEQRWRGLACPSAIGPDGTYYFYPSAESRIVEPACQFSAFPPTPCARSDVLRDQLAEQVIGIDENHDVSTTAVLSHGRYRGGWQLACEQVVTGGEGEAALGLPVQHYGNDGGLDRLTIGFVDARMRTSFMGDSAVHSCSASVDALSYEWTGGMFEIAQSGSIWIQLMPFPPATDAGRWMADTQPPGDHDVDYTEMPWQLHTPYGTYAAEYVDAARARMHVSNGRHVIQVFRAAGREHLVLDGRPDTTITAALRIGVEDIDAIVMDVFLEHLQGLS